MGGGAFGMMAYRVVQIDGATGAVTVLHETYSRDEAGECYRAAKRRHTRAGTRVMLLARPDPGWEVVGEL